MKGELVPISKELEKLITNDYQDRKGEYPKSNIPDSIEVSEVGETIQINIDFKSTDEKSVNSWYNSSQEKLVIDKFRIKFTISTKVIQDGDYKDDCIQLQITLIKKTPRINKTVSKSVQKVKVDDKEKEEFEYTYILSSATQIQAIDLLKYKAPLQTIIKDYFKEKLVKVVIDKISYTITLNTIYTVGEKRRLGRLISQKTDLKKYVRKIAYNNAQDSSGQLFILKKPVKKEIVNETPQ